MGAGKIGRSDNCPQIMRVFNVIQQNDKRRLALFPCKAQNILHGSILISRHAGDYPLMPAGFRHPVKAFLFHVLDLHIPFYRLALNRHNRAVLAPVQNIHPVNRLSRAQSFRHRVPALHQQFVYLFFFHTFPRFLLRHAVPAAFPRFLLRRAIPAAFPVSSCGVPYRLLFPASSCGMPYRLLCQVTRCLNVSSCRVTRCLNASPCRVKRCLNASSRQVSQSRLILAVPFVSVPTPSPSGSSDKDTL